MEGNPTLPQAPTRRIRKERRRNYLQGTKFLGEGHIVSQCPNKRTTILREDGDIDSESSHEETSTFGSKGYSSEEVSFEGDLRMVKRLMSAFVKDD
ncbi:hypothetical protein CR513_23611, partial [Mucuna pruriens]